MKQVINDIHFEAEDLVQVRINSFKIDTFIDGHLFLKSKSGKLFLILKAGEVLTKEFSLKYFKYDLYILKVNSADIMLNIEKLICDFKLAKDEVFRRDSAKRLLDYCLEVIQDYDESILGICISFFKEFYSLPKKNLIEQYEASSVINQRSLLIGTISTLFALSDSHCHFNFLKDLFSLSFHLDVGLLKNNEVCYHLIRACEEERSDNNGRMYLESIREEKLETFINHPVNSYEFLKRQIAFFDNKKIIKIVSRHHENSFGNGFPRGSVYEAQTEAELYLNCAESMVSFDLKNFGVGDTVDFIFELKEFSNERRYLFIKNFYRKINLKTKHKKVV